MAAGDVTVFDQAIEDIGNGVFGLNANVHQFALIVDETTPVASTAAPAWSEGATTDLSDSEVTPGGNYSADGVADITNTWSQTSGTGTYDAADIDIEQNGSNPTDARWGIIFDEDATNNEALLFLDLGSNTDLSAGDFAVTWNGSGIFTIS